MGKKAIGKQGECLSILLEWLSLACKVFIVSGEHDTRESINELRSETRSLSGLHIMEDIQNVASLNILQ